ncbi:MAG: GlsB/YeaQ/YmgE family stress response membrane protein [Gemmataceae bacterium]|nr:GlsB/YeaQ/YmgE family stress response membrane protein [Gemmataceae bacterium]
MSFLWFIMIGIVAGWLAGMIMKGGGYGLLGDLIVGVLGAVLGGFLFGLLGLSATGLLGSLVTATVGAIVLIALLRVVARRPK